jgi:hypothetical protein
MTSTPAIAAIRSGESVVFSAHKMLTTSSAMSALAKNPDLVYKIAFFHFNLFGLQR